MIESVVVTGATGFIGKAVTLKLLEQGKKVYAIDIDKDKLEELNNYGNIIPIVACYEEYKNIKNKIVEKIDGFYHFAFEGGFAGSALKDYELQLRNTKYACDAVSLAIELGCKKFIYASTVNEIEIKEMINGNEFKPRYTCIYSGAKVATQVIAKTLAYNHDMQFITGLVAMPYGENNRANTLPNILIQQLLNNESPKLVEGNNRYDLVYIDDVANAFIAIGEKGVNFKAYYIGHRELKTFRQLVTEIKEILNPKIDLKFGEFKDSLDLNYELIDLDQLYRDTGFECKADFEESILRTAKWLEDSKISN